MMAPISTGSSSEGVPPPKKIVSAGASSETRRISSRSAATYLAYARLALCALPGWALVLFVFGFGMSMVAPKLETALTVPQLVVPFVLSALPSLVLLHVFWTVADYARVELTLATPGTTRGASTRRGGPRAPRRPSRRWPGSRQSS